MSRLAALRRAGLTQRHHTALVGAVSIALRCALLLAKFAFIVILAKHSSADTVGIYALLVTTSSVAIYLIGLEIHTFTGREIVSDDGNGRGSENVQSHFKTLIGIFIIAIPIIWGFIYWIDLFGKFSLALFTAIILLEIFGNELGRYLLMLSRPVASNVLQFIRGAAWMPVPMVVLFNDHQADPIGVILWSWLAGTLAACAFGFWRIRAFLVPWHRFRFEWLVEAFTSARFYFAVALLQQVQYYSDRFVIQFYMGEGAVGVLSFYQSFASTMVAFVQTGVVSVMLPRLILAANNSDPAGESRVRRAMFVWAIALAAAIAGMLALGMPFVLQQMDKTVYATALPVFYVLLIGNLILIVGVVVHLSLYARRLDAQLMRVSMAVVPVGLLINILVVPRFGLLAAAGVFCLVALVDLAAKTWVLKRSIASDRTVAS